jgi:phenylacetic acid degradation operon negative regulatory protein
MNKPDLPGHEDLVVWLLEQIKPRGKSLIMTVFGDSILPHGGGTWLGDLIELLGPLGLNERVIRTSVFRLIQDDLLSAEQDGRRSFYALTTTGARLSNAASSRIYALRSKQWSGTWTQVWLPDKPRDDDRRTLSRELSRQGFAAVTPDIMMHTGEAFETARLAIGELQLADSATLLTVRDNDPDSSLGATRTRVTRWWPLDDLGSEYLVFNGICAGVNDVLTRRGVPTPRSCFVLRSLLVHAYRRIALKDPFLPCDLVPANWPGATATERMAELYFRISDDAQVHVQSTLQGRHTSFSSPIHAFSTRFRNTDQTSSIG